MICFYFIRNRF